MIDVLGENYFIDLDKIEEYLEIDDNLLSITGDTESETKINLIKFEMIKMLLDTILTENNEVFDEKLGLKGSAKTSIPFRLAFNTLLNKKLINRY
jgi:hypothetical protein